LLGLFIPSALNKEMIHKLHPWVAYGIMPIFAFANAGVPLGDIAAEQMMSPMPLGIILGLFAGKQLGIFTFSWCAIKLQLATKPQGASWLGFYSVCIIAGVGFTMSLFIGGLAFADPALVQEMRLAVLIGSLLSALAGMLLYALSIGRTLKKP
jgi:NhaA family Na+:H+ antiporter